MKVHQSPISRLHKILKVGYDIVHSSKILGVTLDDQLCFNHMVNETCKTCFFKLSEPKNLHHFLSHDMKIVLVKSLIISRLDHCSYLYSYIPKYLLNRLKKVLNACIRFIFSISVYSRDSLLPYYEQCHILPIECHVQYKLCLPVYKVLNDIAPVYLKSLFHIYVPSNDSLRSASDNLRIVTDQGCDKTISSEMCIAWNSLPLKLRACPSLKISERILKLFASKSPSKNSFVLFLMLALCFLQFACFTLFFFFLPMLALSVQLLYAVLFLSHFFTLLSQCFMLLSHCFMLLSVKPL